jgi:SulP family sulfate permease
VSAAQQASSVARERRIPSSRQTPGAWTCSILTQVRTTLAYFARPVHLIRTYDRRNLQPDLMAGLTIAILALPQAIAFALIAELPPHVGLYSAIAGSIVGGLWGSSDQLQTGPTNTTSLLVLSVLLTIAIPDTPEYLQAAGIMALMVGVFRLVMGLARLGILVNFVSGAVVVGFTAGAGILIFVNQLRTLLRLNIPSSPMLDQTIVSLIAHITETHWPSLLIGGGTIILVLFLRKVSRRLPAPLISMAVAALAVGLLGLDAGGVRVVGELPKGLPPLAQLPITDWSLMQKLLTGSLAVAAIGLVESMSIARVISGKTGQQLDSNQEFVGQGLANIVSGIFTGYACSGSFTRSIVNFNAGARTGIASVFAGLFVLFAMLALAPLAAWVPLAALSGVLILTAYGLIDRQVMARIWYSGHGDRAIMVVTLLATLVLPLQFAVLTGIALSLIYYLKRTSTPQVRPVLPDDSFRHFEYQPDKPQCTQLGIIEILGDLYFGATNHIEESIRANLERNPDQRYLLLRMHTVENCDISGINALESIVRTYRERDGDVYLVRVNQPALYLMRTTGFYEYLGADHFLDPDEAISHLFYRVIDPAICVYECPVRAFIECQDLPKQTYPHEVRFDADISPDDVPAVGAQALWSELREETPPQIIDVREPREFNRGHIPGAHPIPLPTLLERMDQVPSTHPVVIVCRGGRRSTRATALLRERGYSNVRVLRGGMIAWERERLLEAVE